MKRSTTYRDNLEYVGRLTFLIDNDDVTHLNVSFNRTEKKLQHESKPDEEEYQRSYDMYIGICHKQGLTPISFENFKISLQESESISVTRKVRY